MDCTAWIVWCHTDGSHLMLKSYARRPVCTNDSVVCVHFPTADDDLMLGVPELAHVLERLQRHPAATGWEAYFGHYYWTSWHRDKYVHYASSTDHETVAKRAADCLLASQQCSGPFPFATGSLQGLSFSLASAIAQSHQAEANVLGAQALLTSLQRRNYSRSTPAYEDAWMGFALIGLLPQRSPPRKIAVVSLAHGYFFDSHGFSMSNMTMLVDHTPIAPQQDRTPTAHGIM